MFVPLDVLVLGLQLVVPVADAIPNFNISALCRADAAVAAQVFGTETDSCRKDEHAARDQLAQQWTQFARSDQESCTALASEGDQHSYVQLLTCLQMNRDAKNLSGAK